MTLNGVPESGPEQGRTEPLNDGNPHLGWGKISIVKNAPILKDRERI
jgi:hypothetical protein